MLRTALMLAAFVAAVPTPWAGRCSSQDPQPADRSEFRMRMVVTRDRKETNIRFNMRTGEAWLVAVNKTDPIKEKDVLQQGEYDVRTESGETSWWAFRIERKTGKAWSLSGGQWFEMLDAAAPAEGDYEVMLKTQGDTLWIRRFDRMSGRLWYGKWTGKAYEWIEMGGAAGEERLPPPLPPVK